MPEVTSAAGPAASNRESPGVRIAGARGPVGAAMALPAAVPTEASTTRAASARRMTEGSPGPWSPPVWLRRGGSGVEDVLGDQLLEVAVVPPRDLELLGPAEVQLDVVLHREADAAED